LGSVIAFKSFMYDGVSFARFMSLNRWESTKIAKIRMDIDERWRAEPRFQDDPKCPSWLRVGDALDLRQVFSRCRGFVTWGSPFETFAHLWPAVVQIGRRANENMQANFEWINFYDPSDIIASDLTSFGISEKGDHGKLVASAWANYGIEMTLAEATDMRDRFFATYRTLGQWMRHHADRCQREGRIVIGAGRVIEAAGEPAGIKYTLACNAPIQGACADCTIRAVVAVHRRMPGILVAQIHDELLAEVPEAKAEEAVVVLKEAMVEAFTATFPGAPTRGLVDVKIGRNWADLV
jgi:DNA polymerase family A